MKDWIIAWSQHLPVLPIVVPLVAGASLLLLRESHRMLRGSIAALATLLQLATALALLSLTTDAVPNVWPHGIGVYAIGSWPAPFGIVLVIDRLSAFMLTVTAALALAALVYSLARWERVGMHYHTLFQFLLMGLNGAFLTGDLFNLFVFFEVLLAASYGLLLHGSGAARVKSGLHYIVVNLAASLLFLIGAAMIYGVLGTLNMADMAVQVIKLSAPDRGLFEAGVAILGVAFLVKAGSWPLNFWLPLTYAAAGAPVAAVFSIMTKVGVYAVLRIGSLLTLSGAPAPFAGDWLLLVGLATIVFGAAGMLSAHQLGRLIGFAVVVSSGTVLAAVGLDARQLTAPALFYLLTSVLATGAFFMLHGMTERTRPQVSDVADAAPLPPVTYLGFERLGQLPGRDAEPEEGEEVGIAIPAAMAFLGLAFVLCVLLVTGLPPLSGFIAKFALLATALSSASGGAGPAPLSVWLLIAALLMSGLAGVIALVRIGMRLFWSPVQRTTPRLRVIEATPVAFLLLLCIGSTVAAGPLMTYLDSAAATLQSPRLYIDAVLSPESVGALHGEGRR